MRDAMFVITFVLVLLSLVGVSWISGLGFAEVLAATSFYLSFRVYFDWLTK